MPNPFSTEDAKNLIDKSIKKIYLKRNMPLTKTGKKVLSSMKEQYGAEKGKNVFYASINKGKAGSSQWHKKKKWVSSDTGKVKI